MARTRIALPILPLLWGATTTVLAGGEGDWPCCHGPARDNRSAETGLLSTWP